MTLTKISSKGPHKIELTKEDIESAVRAFICSCHPEMAVGFVINPAKTEISKDIFVPSVYYATA